MRALGLGLVFAIAVCAGAALAGLWLDYAIWLWTEVNTWAIYLALVVAPLALVLGMLAAPQENVQATEKGTNG